jgi:hypothetical protein
MVTDDSEALGEALKRLELLSVVAPSAASSARLLRALRTAPRRQPTASFMPAFFARAWRRPALAIGLAAGLCALGATSVFASAGALPDSPLYAVRNARESVQTAWTWDATNRATLVAGYATSRSAQLEARARRHAGSSKPALTVLVHDIAALMRDATRAAKLAGDGAPTLVRRAGHEVEVQLQDVQQQGTLNTDENRVVTQAISQLQNDDQGQSGGQGNIP